MESEVVKAKDGFWVTRLKEVRLEKPFHYKKDAVQLKERLATMSRWQIEGTYTLSSGHYFRSY